MKTIYLLLCLSLATSAMSQDTGEIYLTKKGFVQNDALLTMQQVLSTMESNPTAHAQMKSANGTNGFLMVLSYTGGALVGYPLGTAIAGGEPEWALAGIGAGLILLSLPIQKSFKKKANSALDTFYGRESAMRKCFKPQLQLASTKNGTGLVLRF